MTPTAVEERAPADIAAARTASSMIVERILSCHEQLAASASLDPAPHIDRLFTELVRTCTTSTGSRATAVLADPRLGERRADLLRICAEGESRLEDLWAQRICRVSDPEAQIAAFPYVDNYHRLVRLELGALAGAGWSADRTRSIGFLGGGPLPLSALLTHRATGSRVDVIDNAAAAVERAERFLATVQPRGGVRVVHADARRPAAMAPVLADSDLVIIAALVGLDRDEKRRVLRAVTGAVAPGTYVVIRSAAELRTMLYPDVSADDVIAGGLTPISLVHPMDDVVNSVWVTRR